MIILKNANSWLPHPAQKYIDAETGIMVKGQTLKLLVSRMTAELQTIGLPIPEDLEQRILNQISKAAPHCCTYINEDAPNITTKKKFTITDVKAFVKSVEGTITSGGVVDQATAEERTNICMRCPYNTNLPGCEGCSGIANLVFKIIGARKTDNMGTLKQCGVCGCSLKAKVWVPQDTVKQTAQVQNNMNDFPDWCWVRK
jgi:hypothetical protein